MLTLARVGALFLTLLIPVTAQAGLTELELGVLVRSSTINEDNFQRSVSYKGSVSYYFWESSALELSYTQGTTTLSVRGSEIEPVTIYRTVFQLIGLDFVLSLADRKAAVQPYVKVGAVHMTRRILREADGGSLGTDEIASQNAVVPSAGAGFKLLLSKSFALKFGVDAWTSPIEDDGSNSEDVTIDYAGRASITWIF